MRRRRALEDALLETLKIRRDVNETRRTRAQVETLRWRRTEQDADGDAQDAQVETIMVRRSGGDARCLITGHWYLAQIVDTGTVSRIQGFKTSKLQDRSSRMTEVVASILVAQVRLKS